MVIKRLVVVLGFGDIKIRRKESRVFNVIEIVRDMLINE